MKNPKGPKYYLITAIVWTVISAAALAVMLFAYETTVLVKICCVFLIGACVGSQWLRYRKLK